MLGITKAEHLEGHKVHLTFNDGRAGETDLRDVIYNDHRAIFSSLKKVDKFRRFRLEFDTLAWPNGLDLVPEFLYFHVFKRDPSLQGRFKEWGYIE
ncbi:MAG: DUF2442 domain-containing protein [bacterium]|nr:DUF2442 domain-containing protein [bacterium]